MFTYEVVVVVEHLEHLEEEEEEEEPYHRVLLTNQ